MGFVKRLLMMGLLAVVGAACGGRAQTPPTVVGDLLFAGERLRVVK